MLNFNLALRGEKRNHFYLLMLNGSPFNIKRSNRKPPESENLGALSLDNDNLRDELEFSGEEEGSGKVENVAIEAKTGVEEEKTSVVWWKLPLELLRYCVFRASPVWSLSVAAAVMGFVILGRRLYKMKRKSRSMQMKVTLDDKVRSLMLYSFMLLRKILLLFTLVEFVMYERMAK